jgi:hypothetical protein
MSIRIYKTRSGCLDFKVPDNLCQGGTASACPWPSPFVACINYYRCDWILTQHSVTSIIGLNNVIGFVGIFRASVTLYSSLLFVLSYAAL